MRYLLLLLHTSFVLASAAQVQVLSTCYTSDNGLPNNNVNCITQDRKGYIWMGTTDGLVQFNGYEFKSFFHSDGDSTSIIGAEVLDIYEDSRSNLWISTSLGLSCLDNQTQRFRNFTRFRDNEHAYSNYITGVLEAMNGNMWVATSYGIHLFNPRTGAFRIFVFRHRDLPGADANYVRKMVKDRDGNLWLGLINGELIHFNTRTHQYQFCTAHTGQSLSSKLDYRLTSLLVDASNNIWAGFRNRGLVCYAPSGSMLQELTQQGQQIPENSILCLGLTRDNQLLVGTNGGGVLALTGPGGSSRAPGLERVSSPKIAALFRDKQENYWLAYVSAGIEVFYARHNQFQSNTHLDLAPSQNKTVLDLCIDHKNRLWLACDASGLLCVDRLSGQTTRYFSNLKNDFPSTSEAVTSVYEDQRGVIWAGSFTGGLSAIMPSGLVKNYRNVASDKRSIAGNSIKDITGDKRGNIWVAIDNRGFSMLDPRTGEFTNYNIDSMFGTSWKNWVFHIAHRDSIVLVSTNDGIIIYDLNTRRVRNHLADSDVKNKYRIGVVPHAFFDKKDRLWLASKNGLLLYDMYKDTLSVFSVKDGFHANAITSISEDDAGNLWLGTFQGLTRFNPATRQVNNFTIRDGLQGNQFNYGACFSSREGELVFGGTNGYTVFWPGNITLNPYKPEVDITEFRISNIQMSPGHEGSPLHKDVSCTDTIILKHDQSNISFSFTALNLIQSQKNRYAYKLEGFDNDWVFSGTNRQANYTNLQPGTYVFTVKASNNDGLWNMKGRSIVLVIRPPFWETTWAYTLYVIVTLVLLYFFRQYSIINIKEKHRLRLESVEKEKQEEIHRNKVEFFTEISHEIRTPLTLIIDPLERHIDEQTSVSPQQLTSIYNNAKKLQNLVNRLLDFRKVEATASLNGSTSDIVSFVSSHTRDFEVYAREQDIAIDMQAELPRLPFFFDVEKMETIFNNLLSNALKHTPAGGRISINLSQSTQQGIEYLVVWVENSGKAIDPGHLPGIFQSFYKADSFTEGSGLGLAIVKSLVELHSGTITVQNISDKVRFTILFPVRQVCEPGQEPAPQEQVNEHEDLKPVLLLVEDNGEVREYIRGIFTRRFQVVEAHDGHDGCLKAQELVPDIVISDVMMPVIDGRTLCQNVKSNPLTNHIPVILLTAQNLDHQKIAGLASGADDYIVKPFRSRELELKVQNLLATHNNIRNKMKEQLHTATAPNAPGIPPDPFLGKARAVVQQHIDDAGFDVESFASEMCLSSRQLRRKLQATIGLSPVEMIRDLRLQAARDLLAHHTLQVSEVAAMVGFDDPKYFSRVFAEKFGRAPSEVYTP